MVNIGSFQVSLTYFKLMWKTWSVCLFLEIYIYVIEIDFILNILKMLCMHEFICTMWVEMLIEATGLQILGTGVTGCCEPFDAGARSQTQILCKNNEFS